MPKIKRQSRSSKTYRYDSRAIDGDGVWLQVNPQRSEQLARETLSRQVESFFSESRVEVRLVTVSTTEVTATHEPTSLTRLVSRYAKAVTSSRWRS
jgi:hypothetical protein